MGTKPVETKKNAEEGRFYRYFGPLLDALRDLGGSGTPDEVMERIAQNMHLSDEVQNDLLASGQPRFRNQVAWARYYLVREGLLDSSKRGVWSLTERGRTVHLSKDQSKEICKKVVRVYRDERRSKFGPTILPLELPANPNESTAEDYRISVINLLVELPPDGFERLSQRLLRESGFTQVIVTGRSGDGGIDGNGILQINALVSFRVLFQCKRYKGSVAPTHVRDFRGAMAGRADKGIILTTGTFTAEARREASRDGVPAIELIDGEKLVDMLEKLELGLKPITTYEIDQSFFNEFRN